MKKISLIMIMFLICGVLCGETILIKDKVFVRDSLFVDGTADIDTLTVNDAARLPETTFNGKIDLQYYSIENCYNLNIKPDDNAGTGIGFYNSDDVIKARILYTYDEAPVDVLRFENNYNVGLSIDSLGAVTLLNGTSINEFSTDGTLAGDSDDAVPTEKAVKTYADGVNTDDQTVDNFDIAVNDIQLSLEDDGQDLYCVDVSTIAALATSSGLAAALSDETGTGVAVFSASPTFTGTVNVAALTATGTVQSDYYKLTADNFNAGYAYSAYVHDTSGADVKIPFVGVPYTNSGVGGGFFTNSSDGLIFSKWTDNSLIGQRIYHDGVNYRQINKYRQGFGIEMVTPATNGYMRFIHHPYNTAGSSGGTFTPTELMKLTSAGDLTTSGTTSTRGLIVEDGYGIVLRDAGSAASTPDANTLKFIHPAYVEYTKFYYYDNQNFYLNTASSTDRNFHIINTGVGNANLIVDGGNVGIGTTSPETALHIDTGDGNTRKAIMIRASDYRFLTLAAGGDNDDYITWDDGDNLMFGVTSYDSEMVPDATYMTITSGGNVGIGTTSPSCELDVSGQIKADNFITDEVTNHNVFVGDDAGGSLTESVCVGEHAGGTSTGTRQTSVGYSAGYDSDVNYVTAIGYNALKTNSGEASTGIGYLTGQENSGAHLSAFGYTSGRYNTGDYVTSMGTSSATENTGDGLTAVGYGAGAYNSGADAISIGFYAGTYNEGSSVTNIGVRAGYGSFGAGVTAIGSNAFKENDGSSNTAIGYEAFNSFAENTGNIKTFSYTDINVGDDQVTVTGHGLGDAGDYIALLYTEGTGAIGGLDDDDVDIWQVVDVNTIEVIDDAITSAGTGTGHTLTPRVNYANSTAIGYDAEPTASNQVMLGDTNVLEVVTSGVYVSGTKTPSSASDTGTTGTICWDADYIYICTATDTWKRVAIATW